MGEPGHTTFIVADGWSDVELPGALAAALLVDASGHLVNAVFTSSDSIAQNIPFTAGVRRSYQGANAFLVNGKINSFTDDGRNETFTHNSIGVSTGGQGSASLRVTSVYLWNKNKSNDLLLALHENPWKIFRPQQRRVYIGVAAAGDTLMGQACL
jgi:hypothetical protein